MAKKNRSKKKAIPLAPPPAMRSRKRARVVTTLFHKYTRERDEALARGDSHLANECEKKIEEMGGRQEYQRASQLSTMHHSTSRWVLGHLARSGWLYGIREEEAARQNEESNKRRQRKIPRRNLRLLEVGAINTELLDAAAEMKPAEDSSSSSQQVPKFRLDVRAIDLHSMHERIEEADFLTFPIQQQYDVVVCSMVINCVTTPEDRGLMLARLFHQLRPGGLCFLTLPKLCLTQSPYITPALFRKLLSTGGVGFHIEETKDSPKISFFVLRRPDTSEGSTLLDSKWTKLVSRHKGSKYRNQFAVILNADHIRGKLD